MRPNRIGLLLGALYLVPAVVLLCASSFTEDNKGAVVLGQLAVLPGLLVLAGLGLGGVLERTAWLNSYPVMLVLNLALAYGIGWLIGRLRAGGAMAWLLGDLAWMIVAGTIFLALLVLVPSEVPIVALVILGGIAALAVAMLWKRLALRSRR